jgi:hypothetical protein
MKKAVMAGIKGALLAVAASAALVACGGGGDGGAAPAPTPAPGPGTGTLRVALTDAPACGFDQVNVTVERVRVHASMTANDNDGGWTDLVMNPARKIDLLTLQNGVLMELGQTALPAGTYTQVRLVLSPNGSGSPANSVKPTGGSETPMDTPSAMQSGLKLINGFTVQAGQLTDVVIDFDACKSVVTRGNGTYGLKPVMQMIPRSLTAITGYVEAGVAGVTVSAQKNGLVLRATQPNANGQFVLAPVDPAKGPYDVVFTAAGRTTSVITAVPVALDQATTVSAAGNAVTMPTSAAGVVSGKLLPAGAQSTGSVRAMQSVGAGPLVEVAHMNVNPSTGDYSFTLPLAPPRLLAHASGNLVINPLPFVAQAASAGKYKLEGLATGYQTKLGGELTLGAAALTGQDISLSPSP